MAKAPVCIGHAEGGICETGGCALSVVGVHLVQAFPLWEVPYHCVHWSHMTQVLPLKVTMYLASSMRPTDTSVM